MSMLEVKEIRKSFDGKTQVLNGIDVSVSKGEVIAILGPSGGGKTTLLRCINFLEKADSGSFSLERPMTLRRLPGRKSRKSGAKQPLCFRITTCF